MISLPHSGGQWADHAAPPAAPGSPHMFLTRVLSLFHGDALQFCPM